MQRHFYVPRPEHLARYRVIITTCLSSALLMEPPFLAPTHRLKNTLLDLPNVRDVRQPTFSHVLIDEAGQALLPEALLPMLLLRKSSAGEGRGMGDPRGVLLCGD